MTPEKKKDKKQKKKATKLTQSEKTDFEKISEDTKSSSKDENTEQ